MSAFVGYSIVCLKENRPLDKNIACIRQFLAKMLRGSTWIPRILLILLRFVCIRFLAEKWGFVGAVPVPCLGMVQ
ncbi:hypothetical protein OCA10_29705 [Bacillus cereus]|nr:hypothetical protein [Bacillus cereus]